jgi:FAD dependent oxidoreductase
MIQERKMKTDSGNAINEQQGLEVFRAAERRRRLRPASTWTEPARQVPVFAETDVLVVGGGPAGTAAAVAAARLGADVTLVERYNHLGGLSTGGLVIWIDRMTDWTGKQVIAGFARDLFDRLPKDSFIGPAENAWGSRDAGTAGYWLYRSAAYHGVVTWSPTVDPEALKTLLMQFVLEYNIRLVLHSWAAAPIMNGNVVRGAVFESKEGRQAILAKVVVDTTGDADIIYRAGGACEADIDKQDVHHCMNTAFLFGGVDMARWIEFRSRNSAGFAGFMAHGRDTLGSFEKPFPSWRNDIALFMGPRLSGFSAVDVEDLTEVEVRSRQLAVNHLEYYRKHAPGFENAFLMMGAPQLGVRHSRRMVGLGKVTREDWVAGRIWEDEIGVSTSLAPKFANVSVPYGALVPAALDGILAAGRHIACDPSSHSFMREIPQCWMTGQAAGIAAALASGAGQQPRTVNVRSIQQNLLRQSAYLSPSVEAVVRRSADIGADQSKRHLVGV